jgi:hypothetical protein
MSTNVGTKKITPIDASSLFNISSQVQTDIGSPVGTWTKKQPESVGRTRISWAELYPSEEVADPKVVAAQRLLTKVIKRFEDASQVVDDDPVAADDYVQSTHPLLAELFCCRSIGDGFAAIVNGISISVLNQHGEALSKKQITLITRSLKELKSQLFLSFDSALRSLREFKKQGLKIYPEALQHLDLKHD